MMTGLLFKSVARQRMRGVVYSRRHYSGYDPEYPGLPADPGGYRQSAVNCVRWLLHVFRVQHPE